MDFQRLPQYQLIEKRDLTDIGSAGYLLRHIKSGARLMLIENEDDNKVFNIVFRTTPSDSTGVAHIIEHTVLCGSAKYPSKDPFVELVKGSMNTFLNAMTYPDKTMFPVASCNDRDFKNLMDVYLDAVFHPNIYRNEQIFRQEGWNYEIEREEDPIVYNGVVYNEMKGAFSSPDDVLERRIMNSLFPDTTYGVESGGDPQFIPDLTYEQFLAFHRKYYNPSNSYIYLYGKMDFEERLEYLDREYLSAFSAQETGENGPAYSEVAFQKPFDRPQNICAGYPVAESDPLEKNTYLSWNTVVSESGDTKLANAMAALDYVLLDAPGAPLKIALIDAGIGQDVYGSYDSGIRQPVFSVIAKNADASDAERFSRVIRETLTRLADEGLNPKALEAAVNSMEFKYREADYGGYPKGLIYSIDVFDSWLYRDDQAFDYLVQLGDYRFLREKIHTGYFEDLIRRYLLDNPHASFVILEPSRGLSSRAEEKVREKLAAYKASLSQEEIRDLIAETGKLRTFQETPSAREQLLKIPMLRREDLEKKARGFSNLEVVKDGVKLVRHEYPTNGIVYLTMYLDASVLRQEDFPYLGILKNVLGEVDTEHYSYGDLANEINRRTGGVTPGITVLPSQEDASVVKAGFGIQIAALPDEVDFAMEIAAEILLTSKIDDAKRLREILQEVKSRTLARLTSSGSSTAVTRALSGFSAEYLLSDSIGGIRFYDTVCEYVKQFDEKKDELTARLEEVLRRVIRKAGFLVSYTGDESHAGAVLDKAAAISRRFPDTELPAGQISGVIKPVQGLHFDVKKEGFKTPGKVQYVAQGGNYADAGLPCTGLLSVLRVIMNYDYLWTNLRVVGGAYGCGASFARNGAAAFYSYRDPHLEHTLGVYRKITDYLKNFTADDRDMTKYVIGTISDFDTPLTPKMAGSRSMSAYLTSLTQEELQRQRDQVLGATQEDIRSLAPYIEAVLNKGAVCVVGSEEKIKQAGKLFDTVRSL